jgi:hypothetical protein
MITACRAVCGGDFRVEIIHVSKRPCEILSQGIPEDRLRHMRQFAGSGEHKKR